MLDTVVAATAGVIAISLAGETEPAIALLPLSIGAIYAGGALKGNNNVNKCRKEMGEWESYMAAREALPPGADGPPLPEPRRMPPPEVASTQQSAPPMAPIAVAPPPAAPIAAPPTAPPAAPTTAPTPAAPQAPQAPQARPAAKPGKPAPPPAPPPKDDDWADFWREVE